MPYFQGTSQLLHCPPLCLGIIIENVGKGRVSQNLSAWNCKFILGWSISILQLNSIQLTYFYLNTEIMLKWKHWLSPNLFLYLYLAQNINEVNWLIIPQKKALNIMDFKNQLFQASPFFFTNTILKLGVRFALFVNKSSNRHVPPKF